MVYLVLVRDCLAKSGCVLHAYCLMTNHMHLLLTPPAAEACAVLMRQLGQRYVQYFNSRYARTGTLWEGRFRSCLVDSAQYVLACYRYIERNPLRAGMVNDIAHYKWSSYFGNAGHSNDDLLTPHSEYVALGENPSARTRAYQALFGHPDDSTFLAQVRDATNGGYPLVGERMMSALAARSKRPLERRKPGPPSSKELGETEARSPDLF